MRKTYYSLITGLILLVSLFSTTLPVKVDGQEITFDVGIIYNVRGLGDNGVNDLAKAGIDRSLAKHSALIVDEACTLSCTMSEVATAVSTFAIGGYDLVIGVGFASFDPINTSATLNPATNFLIVDTWIDLPNVASIDFKEQEGTFLAGAMAAMVSETKTLGFLGGLNNPLINSVGAGFEHGARFIDESVNVLIQYSPDLNNPWNDSEGGKLIARQFIDREADIIFGAAGDTGLGIIDAVEEHNSLESNKAYAIGVDGDKDGLSSGNILLSMFKDFGVAIELTIDDSMAGAWSSGLQTLGLAENGVGITQMTFTQTEANVEYIPGQTRMEKIDELKAMIINGEIEVYDAFEDIKFLPPLVVDPSAYVQHNRIDISSNSDFGLLKFPGFGSESLPYIIEGLNITDAGGTLIMIQNTDAHFVIRNNYLDGVRTEFGQDDGIFLADVKNGEIRNNILVNCSQLLLHRSTNILIDGNLLYGEPGIGIGDFSNNTIISNNEILGASFAGISFHLDSFNNSAQFNDISRGSGHGLNIIMGSHQNYIHNNTIYNNRLNGIDIADNNYNEIMGNQIYDNRGSGIYQSYATFQVIFQNDIFNNRWDGIRIVESHSGGVFDNDIHDNQENGVTVAFGSGQIVVRMNRIFENGANGIFAPSIIGNQFTNNSLFANGHFGIWIGNGAIDNLIDGNDIYNNQMGILIAFADNTQILSNLIHDNWETGITLQEDAIQNVITYNLIYNHPTYGLYCGPTSLLNTISNNDFNNNDLGSVGDDGTNNLLSSNYYNEWDGIGDYLITGGASNFDSSALNNPIHISSLTATISDGGLSIIRGEIDIIWNEVVDLHNHEIIYEVQYMHEGGDWMRIYSGILTMFTFDTRLLNDGELLLRVVAIDELGYEVQYIIGSYEIDNLQSETSLTSDTVSNTDISTTADLTTSLSESKDDVETPAAIPINYLSTFFGLFVMAAIRMKRSTYRKTETLYK